MSDRYVVLGAIAAITLLASIWILTGHNHTTLTLAVGAIAGLAGLSLPQLKLKKKS